MDRNCNYRGVEITLPTDPGGSSASDKHTPSAGLKFGGLRHMTSISLIVRIYVYDYG